MAFEVSRIFFRATEYDVRQWHAQMVVTRAAQLGDTFRSAGEWWDISQQVQDAVLQRNAA